MGRRATVLVRTVTSPGPTVGWTEASRKGAGANGRKEAHAAPYFCPRSFDRAVMVAQWYDL